MDFADRLGLVERLGKLHQDGALTVQEFASAKASILAQDEQASIARSQAIDVQRETPVLASRGPKWAAAAAVLILIVAGAGTLLWPAMRTSSLIASKSREDSTATIPAATTAGGQTAIDTPPSGSATSGATEGVSNADAALNAASEAAAQMEAPQTAYPAATADSLTVLSTRPARCRVTVPGQQPMTGTCTYKAFPDGQFEISSSETGYAVQLIRSGEEFHGLVVSSTGSRSDIGELIRKGACWSSANSEICAWAS